MSAFSVTRSVAALRTSIVRAQPSTFTIRRTFASKIDQAAQAAGEAKKEPSVFSSEGAVGKQFNPDGNIGQLGEKIGGPFSAKKGGVVGSQFDASQEGLAGKVEKAVDGPRNPATAGGAAQGAADHVKNKL